jgi:CubicO group peptidase (beta-lactamase class C family)
MVTVFSTSKGMASMAVAVAHARGLFELDEMVATYWPEFAQHGKDGITVRQLLAHEAGLAAIDTWLDIPTLADADALGAVLAAQAPKWTPGSMHGYHAQSLGWYESQLLRRVDPAGRGVGQFFAEAVAAPLDLEFHLGLPDEVPASRLAEYVAIRPVSVIRHIRELPTRLILALFNPRSMTGRAFRNPKALASANAINDRALLRIELPSVNGTGEIRSIAKAYGSFATGGATLGLTPATLAELERPVVASADRILKVDTAFANGFMKPFPLLPFGSSGRAFGHTGMGGSFGFADPDLGLGYAYGMNRAGVGIPTDPREAALRTALYRCVS